MKEGNKKEHSVRSKLPRPENSLNFRNKLQPASTVTKNQNQITIGSSQRAQKNPESKEGNQGMPKTQVNKENIAKKNPIRQECEILNEILSTAHQPSCGCSECVIKTFRELPCKNVASFMSCIDSFIKTKTCPLSHPHDDTQICSEYLRLEKEPTMIHLNSVISSMLEDSAAEMSAHRIPTVKSAKASPSLSPYLNYSKIKESVQSVVNLQNLTSLTK